MLNAAGLCVLKHSYSTCIYLSMTLVMRWANVTFLCTCAGFRSFRAVGSLGQLRPETNAHPERETAREPSGPTAPRRNPPPHREQTWTDWWDAPQTKHQHCDNLQGIEYKSSWQYGHLKLRCEGSNISKHYTNTCICEEKKTEGCQNLLEITKSEKLPINFSNMY